MTTRRILEQLADAARGSAARDPDMLAADTYLEHVHRQDLLRHIRITVVGTWLLVIAIAIAWLCAGCTHDAKPITPTRMVLTPVDAMARSVRIERVCFMGDAFAAPPSMQADGGNGSGVVYETGVVLTANHVIKCPPHSARMIRVVGADNIKLWAEVAAVDAAHDIARLSVRGVYASKAELATPVPGEIVCSVNASPERNFACGIVGKVEPMKTKENGEVNIWHSARTIPGNSGAGVYNRWGQLVGLATNGYKPEQNMTGGLATTLLGRIP